MKTSPVPKYSWGQQVAASVPLLNDGSYPDCDEGFLLVKRGALGEVIQVGMHVESDTPVYLVAFSGERIVGCVEDEIIPA